MKKGLLILIFLVVSCKTITSDNTDQTRSTNPIEVNNLLLEPEWFDLKREQNLYPLHHLIAGLEGCSTVEYIITPDNKISNIEVISSSNKYFKNQKIKDAIKTSINNWNWKSLPKNIIKSPIKTQTRFDFCIKEGSNTCDSFSSEQICSSEDIILVIGQRIRK